MTDWTRFSNPARAKRKIRAARGFHVAARTIYNWQWRGGDPWETESLEFGSLEDALEAAQEQKADIVLTDEAGFQRGWVHADGSWKLT